MPLYEMTAKAFRPLPTASFTDMKVRERDDLQRLLRSQIEVLGEDLYVITEEFGGWEDSRRRIDLLAIDREANLVVVELKRTNDGGHMDLQAVRYASMISAMTFERAEQIHAEFLSRMDQPPEEAQSRILKFLGWEEPDVESFAPDVRIILVAEDFSKEVTTAALWLRDHDVDVRCIRLRPYQDNGTRLIDVQPIIPLPELNDYQIQIQRERQEVRKIRAKRHDERLRFWQGLIAEARQRGTRHANLKPGPYPWIGAGSGIGGLGFNYSIGQGYGAAELYIARGGASENKAIFDQIHSRKADVERLFGGDLSWERLDGKQSCRIKCLIEDGGYRSPESEWPQLQANMVDAMSRLEVALKPSLEALKV